MGRFEARRDQDVGVPGDRTAARLLAGLVVILVVPVGLATARLVGFTPSTQILTAVETIAANRCWVPPLVGWIVERHRRRDVGR